MVSVKKSAAKSPKPPRGKPFVSGDPRQKAGPGRPRDEWKAALAAMVTADQTLQHIQRVLDAGPDHPYFDKALAYATERGMGKEPTPIEQTGEVALKVIIRNE